MNPTTFRHGLAGHEVFDRARLVSLAAALPLQDVEHHVGHVPLLLPDGVPERLDITPTDIARGIELNGCWMLYSRLTNHSESAELCTTVARENAERCAAIGRPEGGVTSYGVSVLLAAPGSRVPVHFDNHHVLLLQIAGTKTVHLGSYTDRTRAQVLVERNLLPPRMNADALPDSVDVVTLGPGDGIHIPPFTFHWVVGLDGVSVAASMAVRTPESERSLAVHIANGSLRRLGFHPRPPGASRRADSLKLAALSARNRLGRHRVVA